MRCSAVARTRDRYAPRRDCQLPSDDPGDREGAEAQCLRGYPAVLLGIDFPLQSLRGVPILARAAGLIAHLQEELESPIGFALSYQASRDVEYSGTLPEGVTLKPV
jgi:hypothetical protein